MIRSCRLRVTVSTGRLTEGIFTSWLKPSSFLKKKKKSLFLDSTYKSAKLSCIIIAATITSQTCFILDRWRKDRRRYTSL